MKVIVRTTQNTEVEFYEDVACVAITSSAGQYLVVTESDEGTLWLETAQGDSDETPN